MRIKQYKKDKGYKRYEREMKNRVVIIIMRMDKGLRDGKVIAR